MSPIKTLQVISETILSEKQKRKSKAEKQHRNDWKSRSQIQLVYITADDTISVVYSYKSGADTPACSTLQIQTTAVTHKRIAPTSNIHRLAAGGSLSTRSYVNDSALAAGHVKSAALDARRQKKTSNMSAQCNIDRRHVCRRAIRYTVTLPH